MTQEKKVLIFFAVLAVIGFGWYQYNYISAEWRFKITVSVETPEGLRTGSSVYEMSNSDVRHRIFGLTEGGNSAEIKGEAVVVDLDKRGILFALIPDQMMFYNVFPPPNGGATRYEGIDYYKHLKNRKVTLNPSEYPAMVMFKDIKDPKTVEAVRADALAATFGEGVKLKDITIEMTDEPVTWEIEKVLGWLEKVKMSYLSGKHINGSKLYEQLHGGNFQVGE